MKKTDFLFLLQEIWEQEGMLNYLRINFIDEKKCSLELLEKIILFGLDKGYFILFDINERVLDKNKYYEIILNEKNWFVEHFKYEVIFDNLAFWRKSLFVDKKIPEEFKELNGIFL
ncbi:hypothetical protein [Culicoidibacter larvae]|uniref:Uncharacterized protein n=1 Tax=Culicoidibacter larvae TaxID=2579976 RepID=A0A5R8QFY7_9FIRM|nr:hypothetical protein [Culicoidibacter larvae]TLG76694.1 hypothetical protein FEZ08_03510 [Culicoidibacter larvae]